MTDYEIGIKETLQGQYYLYFISPSSEFGGKWVSTTQNVGGRAYDKRALIQTFYDFAEELGSKVQRVGTSIIRMPLSGKSQLEMVAEEFALILNSADNE